MLWRISLYALMALSFVFISESLGLRIIYAGCVDRRRPDSKTRPAQLRRSLLESTELSFKARVLPECSDSDEEIWSQLIDVFQQVSSSSDNVVIIFTGPEQYFHPVSDFSRELRVPLLVSSPVHIDLRQRHERDLVDTRHSSAVFLSAVDSVEVSQALVDFLSHLGTFDNVSIICHPIFPEPTHSLVAHQLCSNQKKPVVVEDRLGEVLQFQTIHLVYTSENEILKRNQTVKPLQEARKSSPALFFPTVPTTVETFVSAFQSSLVLSHINDTLIIFYSPEFTWPFNESGFSAINGSVPKVVVMSPSIKCMGITANCSLDGSEDSEQSRVLSMATEMVLQVSGWTDVKETLEPDFLDVQSILRRPVDPTDQLNISAQALRNRTIFTRFGDVRFSSSGSRAADFVFGIYDSSARNRLKPIWYHSQDNSSISTDPNIPDIPHDASSWKKVTLYEVDGSGTIDGPSVGAGLGAAAGIVVVIFAISTGRKYLKLRLNYSSWWRLEPWRVKKYAEKSEKFYGIERAEYDEEPVWIQRSRLDVTMDMVAKNKIARRTLAEIRTVHHENIGKLFGIAIHEGKMELLWQYDRGSLRAVLDDEKFPLDFGLKSSLIFEILTGLQFIHNSVLRFHGTLNSLNTMLDFHYSIKLCAAGSTRIFSSVTNDRTAKMITSTDLWLAPEMLSDVSHPGSREADVYAVAIVMCEIIASGSSIVLDLKNSASIIRTLSAFTTAVSSTTNEEFNHLPPEFRNLIAQAFVYETKDRPRVSAFLSSMNKHFERKSVMDRMLERFQQYSEDLEVTVRARTHETELEGKKVTALLEEMIPPSLVSRLRNKETIAAEGFECVTIFFSSLIDFGAFCSQSTPLMIVELLNRVYSTFDLILPNFDVYKVETIKDGYMVASGVPLRNGDRHAQEICAMACEFLRISFCGTFLQTNLGRLQIRIGIHSGTVAAGVVGLLMPRYCLFGDSVNTASRMESHGTASRIHISPTTKALVEKNPQFNCVSRGLIEVKGKGQLETFFLNDHKNRDTA